MSSTALTVREYVPLPCVICGGEQATKRYQVRDLIQARDGLWWFVTVVSGEVQHHGLWQDHAPVHGPGQDEGLEGMQTHS